MSSLYSKYIKEREDKRIVELAHGFATYKFFDNGECYLQDIYVLPDFRQTGLAKEMADEVVRRAKEHSCHTLIGSVCIDDVHATRNMQVFLTYGMKLHKIIGTLVFLKKDLV